MVDESEPVFPEECIQWTCGCHALEPMGVLTTNDNFTFAKELSMQLVDNSF